MKEQFSHHDMMRTELFAFLLPRLIYTGTEAERREIFNQLKHDGNGLVHALYEQMCITDGVDYPYKGNDFRVESFERGGVGIIQILFPEYNKDINDILRAYLLYGTKGDEPRKKYFAIKRFAEDGKVFIFHISAKGEGFIGEELTAHPNDMEYEYWKLVCDYAKLISGDMKREDRKKKQKKSKKWSRDWSEFDWNVMRTRLEEAEVNKADGVVDIGITLDEFVEYLQWLMENEPEQYCTVMLSMKLKESGVPMENVEYWLSHPKEFGEVVNRWIAEHN